MVTYVFDTSALIRFLDDEAGAERVEHLLENARSGDCLAVISAVNWGEIIGSISKRHGASQAEGLNVQFGAFRMEVVPATAERAERAALLKVVRNIGYADAFGVELASDSTDHILVTADFGVKSAERDVHIEFLPVKLKP